MTWQILIVYVIWICCETFLKNKKNDIIRDSTIIFQFNLFSFYFRQHQPFNFISSHFPAKKAKGRNLF